MKQVRVRLGVVALGMFLFVSGVIATPALAAENADTVSTADVHAQTTVVRQHLITTMSEYVKLLQMTLITKLEARLDYLQTT